MYKALTHAWRNKRLFNLLKSAQLTGKKSEPETPLQVDKLALVQAALDRIDEGSFGLCTGCRGPIGLDRLEADPSVPMCEMCAEFYA